jgi:tetratricopeptide (TPR) repeat protein
VANQKEKLIKQVDQALQGKNLKKARNLLRKIVAEDSADIRSRLRLGEVLFQLGEKTEALEHLSFVGEYYRQHGFLLKSAAVFKKMIEVDPNRLDFLGSLANLYFQLGMSQDAVKQFKVQIRAQLKAGKVVDSLLTVRNMLEMEPSNLRDRVKLAEAFAQHGMSDDAARELGAVLKLLEKRNAPRAAWVTVAERCLHHNPKDVSMARELAQRLVELARFPAALPWLEVCFNENPEDPQVLDLLAQCFEALGQPTKAVTVLKAMVAMHRKNGLDREIEATYAKILQIDPKEKSALNGLAHKLPPEEVQQGKVVELSWDLDDGPGVQVLTDGDDLLEITTEPPPVPNEPMVIKVGKPETKPKVEAELLPGVDLIWDPTADAEVSPNKGPITTKLKPKGKTTDRAPAPAPVDPPKAPVAPPSPPPAPKAPPAPAARVPDSIREMITAEATLELPEIQANLEDEEEFGFEEYFGGASPESGATMVQTMDDKLLSELGIFQQEQEEVGMVDIRPLIEKLEAGQPLSSEELLKAGVKMEPSEMEELDFFLSAGLVDEARMMIHEILGRK